MNREDFEKQERALMAEIAKRRQLGGFDANAPAVLMALEHLYEITRHLRERSPRPKQDRE